MFLLVGHVCDGQHASLPLVCCAKESCYRSHDTLLLHSEYILKNGGLDTEKDYSYWSVGGMCNKLREGTASVLMMRPPTSRLCRQTSYMSSSWLCVFLCCHALAFCTKRIIQVLLWTLQAALLCRLMAMKTSQ